MDEVWEAMTEEADKSLSLERELKQMHAAVEEEREERRQLAQTMAVERERREELERKLTRLLDLQSGAPTTTPAQ
jgi:chromosome segregation ATPase